MAVDRPGIELWGGDPCPRCGAPLEYDEVGDEREPEVYCPNTFARAAAQQGRGPMPATSCDWIADGFPATNV